MARPIHQMIRVRDEAASCAFYKQAFGLRVAERLAFDDFVLVYLRGDDGPFEVELTINNDQDGPYDLGSGYGHLAVSVDDLDAERARMDAAGIDAEPIKELRNGAFTARYFFVTDPDGYAIEVIERGGRFE